MILQMRILGFREFKWLAHSVPIISRSEAKLCKSPTKRLALFLFVLEAHLSVRDKVEANPGPLLERPSKAMEQHFSYANVSGS